ncbi:MAG: LysM peptidoglycan-binding domain-containing protein [Deltaproteobacteria bacterium]|nr:LysM peptidoglycan-binding domain-containing protein [Deltaproteobacteria bacterium]
MPNRSRQLFCRIPVLILVFALFACTHLPANRKHTASSLSPANTSAAKTSPKKEESPPPVPEMTDQQRIDNALDAYEASQEDWDQGLFDDAINLLDQSYDLILDIPADHDPDILQQKEDLRLLISRRILEIYASRSGATLVNGDGAIPLVMNKYVKEEIKRFQTKERKYFIESYRRAGKYRGYIEEELSKAGLPRELVWLPLIESGYKDHALSRARALGLWQFIASTGARFNLKRDQWVDERMDFKTSTRAAIAYLTALHNLFGDWTTALAAYNCGEGNVLRAIREQRVNYLDNFWDLYPMLPPETARYVPRFLATLQIVKDPAKYGFSELKEDAPLKFEEVTVEKEMKLSDVAKSLSVPTRTLTMLNPALRQKVTPNYAYLLRVPQKKRDLLTAKLDQIPRCRLVLRTYTTHRVRRGETLSQIARRYHASVRTISRLNRIHNVARIRIGQRIRVPLRHPRSHFSTLAKASAGNFRRYRVKHGDTLWSIARKHKTSVSVIKRINGLSSNYLKPGQILRVPVET